MEKQDFQLGQMVKCTLSTMEGVYMITAAKIVSEEDYRGKPTVSFIMYQLNGDDEKWVYPSYLSLYVDKDTVKYVINWFKNNLPHYLYLKNGEPTYEKKIFDDAAENFCLDKE